MGDVLEGSTLIIVNRVQHHALLHHLAILGLPPRLLPAPGISHGPVAADKDNLLIFRVETAAVALFCPCHAPVDQELPHRLLEHAQPALDGGRALGLGVQVARDPADGAALRRAGPESGLALLDAFAHGALLVPELCQLVGNVVVDWVGRTDVPVCWRGGLDVGEV